MTFELGAKVVLKRVKFFTFIAIVYGTVVVLEEIRSHCLDLNPLLLASGYNLCLQRLGETRASVSLWRGDLKVSRLRVMDCKLREKFRMVHERRGSRELPVRNLLRNHMNVASSFSRVLVFTPTKNTLII